ncbi:hypothetical protein DAI22_03g230301 [Oryza sativa Japonica Group]|nr:hypothetical protein DAI22_03g230301 [Oryza sativa Japonica Group]
MSKTHVLLERSIAMLVDRLPPPRQAHDRQGRRPPPEHHEYDAEDESPGLRSDGGPAIMDRVVVDDVHRDNRNRCATRVPLDEGLGKIKISMPSFSGDFSVDAYYKEMELLMSRTGVTENDETTMARFLNGLNDDVKNVMVHIAQRVEQQLKSRHTSRSRSFQRDGDGCAASKSVSFKPTTPFRDGSKPAASSVSKSQSKVESTECYTCGGRRHYMRDCPNQKKVLMTKEGYVSESLSENSEGNGLSMLARAVQRDGSNVDAKGQRCNIFHAIKSMVFSAVKNKKEPCQINPKQRTVLFQGREDDMPKKLNIDPS